MTNVTRELSRDVSKLGILNWESRVTVMDEIAKAAVLKEVHNNTKSYLTFLDTTLRDIVVPIYKEIIY